jgi:hypothetical protein
MSAPFLAQLIANARPGLSPAREARRNPGPALEAYRRRRAPGVGEIVDLGAV